MDAVRAVARRLLTLLPAPSFVQRATDRAAAVVRLERHGQRPWLNVRLPGNLDAAAIRDGTDGRPPSPAIGVGAWRLTQLIAAVPLAGWTELLGLVAGRDRRPSGRARRSTPRVGWTCTPAGGWPPSARAAPSGRRPCSRRAIRTTAAVGRRPPGRTTSGSRPRCRRPRRAERAAALLAGTKLTPGPAAANQAIAEVGGAPMPWPGGLADAVMTILGRAAPLAALPRLPRGLLDLAARGLPATGGRDYAAELTRLADADPQNWTPLVRKTAETVLLRRTFLEEIR